MKFQAAREWKQVKRRVSRILTELKLTESPDVLVIDARHDNKPSGDIVERDEGGP